MTRNSVSRTKSRINELFGQSEEMLAEIVGTAGFDTERQTKGYDSDPEEDVPYQLRRYKVRIFGRHGLSVEEADLPWALAPQTGASGVGGFSNWAVCLAPSTLVWVREQYTRGNTIPTDEYHITRIYPVKTEIDPNRDGQQNTGFTNGATVPETSQEGTSKRLSPYAELARGNIVSLFDEKYGEEYREKLATACENVNMSNVNKEIDDLLDKVNKIRQSLTGTAGVGTDRDGIFTGAQNWVDDLNDDVDEAAKKISKELAAIVKNTAKWIMRKINILVNNLSGNAPVGSRYLVNEATNKTLDTISCLFIRLLRHLAGLIGRFLKQLITRIINTGTCVMDQIISQFLGQLIAQLNALINSILGPISSLLGSVISLTNEILDFVESILKFLECKEEHVCPDLKEWNFLDGAKPETFSLDFSGIFSAAQGVADSFRGVMDIPDDIADYDFDLDIGSAVDAALGQCDTGPIWCGVPDITFWGGTGSGATGDAVIGSDGSWIGVVIRDPGSYETPPLVSIDDPCGNSHGGTGSAGIGTTVFATFPAGIGTDGDAIGVGDTAGVRTGITTGVTHVIIDDSGYGFLPHPDGSRGGGGRTFSGRCQTVVQRANRVWDPPYDEGDPITINSDFTIDMLPGWTEHGTNPYLQSMLGFDDCRGTFSINPLDVKSMVGFDDTRGSAIHPEITPPIPPQHALDVQSFRASLQARGVWDYYRQFDVHNTGYGVPDQFGYVNDYIYARQLGFNDKDIRFYLEGFYSQLLGKNIGPLMRAKLDDPTFGPIPSYITGSGGCGIFDCEHDYPYAQSLGFTDQDIRYFLTHQYLGIIDPCMQGKLDDPTWGVIPDYWVTGAAGPCPPPPEAPTYDVVPVLDDIITLDCGYGYDCVNDTVKITPANGAEAVIEQCDEEGAVCRLRVTRGGNFDTLPEITINTKTGHNGIYKPVLKFLRPSEVAPGTKVLQVIDCVGNVGSSMRTKVNP